MRWRGQGVLGAEAICRCIDLRRTLDILILQLLQRAMCFSSFMLKAYSFSTLLLCKFQPFDYESTLETSCIMSMPRSKVCVYMIFLFLIPTSKDTTCWHVLQAISSPVCMEIPCSAPPLIVSKPAHWSILTTIGIVIDLPYLDPVAIRSHLLSLPYRKGKHSWCYRPKCSVPGCSVGALCLISPPMMDGASSGYTFTPAHPTCSSVGGD